MTLGVLYAQSRLLITLYGINLLVPAFLVLFFCNKESLAHLKSDCKVSILAG
jgi:hypothetical protein